LSRDEEYRLAIRAREQNDHEAAKTLVTSSLRLVVKMAMRYYRYWTKGLLDLIQEGNIGLLQAARNFNPHRGIKFSYYASFWIRAYILRFIMENWRLSLETHIPDSGQDIDDEISEQERKLILRENFDNFYKSLSQQEADIFDKRIMADKPLTLQELGDRYRVSRERIRQIQEKIKKKSKDWLKKNIPNFEQEYSDFV